MANWPLAILLLASSLLWQDRAPAGISTSEFEAERRQANELFLAGKALEALPLYEHLEKLDPNHAVFAERRASWSGLTQWCQRTHANFTSPSIRRPAYTGDGKHFQVPEEFVTEDGTGRSAWLTYLKSRNKYRNPGPPNSPAPASVYRHTLAEEVDSLQLALADLKTKSIAPEKMDPSLRNLQLPVASHLLEPWVLLHGADQGIAEDYPNYRATHREQLHQYIVQFDLGAPML